jgi:hypothetical protein
VVIALRQLSSVSALSWREQALKLYQIHATLSTIKQYSSHNACIYEAAKTIKIENKRQRQSKK